MKSLVVSPCLSSSEYPVSDCDGRPCPLIFSRRSYTWACGTMIVPPPLVSWYGVPPELSLSTIALASVDDRLLNSGV